MMSSSTMRSFVARQAIAAVLFSTSVARGEELRFPPVPKLQLNEPDVGMALSPMKKDQRAPFTGVLLSVAAVADITVRLEQEQRRTKLEVDKALGLQAAEGRFALDVYKAHSAADLAIAKARLDAEMRTNDVLLKRIDKLETQVGNQTLWVGVGVASGVVVTLAIVWATSQASK
jgi:hypothetical protein